MAIGPLFFPSASAFRGWLSRYHAHAQELWVGFHRKGSGRPSLTWEDSVDAALCFGWIDGVRRSAGPLRYVIRFSRRKPRSIWSVRNLGRARELERLGLMEPAGLAALRGLRSERHAVYSYEQRRTARLGPAHERRFRSVKAAWAFFSAQAPSYRRVASWWVTSAKREETRLRRLEALVRASGLGRRVDLLALPKTRSSGRGEPGGVTGPAGRARAPA